MADAAAPRPIDRMGVNWLIRTCFAAVPVAIGLIPYLGDSHLDPATAIPIGLVVFVVGFVAFGRHRVQLHRDSLVLTSLFARVIIPWSDVQSIEAVGTFGQARAAIRTVDGVWRCSALMTPRSRPPRHRVQDQVDLLRAAWFAAGGGQSLPPPPRRWGPEPLTFDVVRLAPVGGQALILTGSIFAAVIYPLVPFLAAAMHGAWTPLLIIVTVAAVAALIAARRRVVLTPAGIESRALTTTTVPWSAVRAITTVSGPWGYRRQGRQNGSGPLHVRLFTTAGPIDLPLPIDDPFLPDPSFDRKVDFIQRCWEAHRGAAWTAPPPPDGWRPPPPAA